MIIDHAGLQVSDLEASRKFYTAALAPLGIEFVRDLGIYAGFGREGEAEFWIGVQPSTPQGTHIGFAAKDREAVRRFFAAAIAAGATVRSEPQVSAIYHPHFYSAMVFDPDGHNIEAVCHLPDVESERR
jgi:catechol 2,3-dioxygenase-like lactoylglutathione lyase family enzyme